jgi:hypothetical protein
VQALQAQVERAFLGQPEVVRQVLAALLAGGHVLIEGVPGSARRCWCRRWPRPSAARTRASSSRPT